MPAVEMSAPFTPQQSYNQGEYREYVIVVFGGALLALNAGFINGCCMSGLLYDGAKKQGVAAFTGAYTNAGMQLAAGNWGEVWNFMSMVLAFIGGAFICGLLNPKPKPWTLGPPYTYGPGFLIGSAFLFAAGAAAEWYPRSGWYFYLAAAANGIQNGMSSTYSANLLRVCHLTGTSTDIGLILAQVVRGERANLWKLFVLVVLAVAFLLGGTVAYVAMHAFASHALLFSACFFLAIGIGCIIFVSVQYKVSILEAASNADCARRQ